MSVMHADLDASVCCACAVPAASATASAVRLTETFHSILLLLIDAGDGTFVQTPR